MQPPVTTRYKAASGGQLDSVASGHQVDTGSPSETAPERKRFSRPQSVARQLKDWIVEQGLQPGDRLPGEPEMIERLGHAKGTIREALRILETEGLIKTRTGPGGGVFVHAVSDARAQALLANYFYFKDLSIRDIYQLRRLIEPELVAELAGRLDEAALQRLEAVIATTEQVPHTPEEEREQHIASLEFHCILGELSGNPLLGFIVRFQVNVLRELTVHRKLYEPINPELREAGRAYQCRLVQALRAGDGESARAIMTRHMKTAQAMMEAQEATIAQRFLGDSTTGK